ncbi:MAG: Flp family type IVb pilin [Dermatophilaceae bacterium]
MTKALAIVQTRIASLRDEKGATAVEYGLMVALIAAAIIGAVALLGDNLVTLFTDVDTAVQGR